MSINETPYEYYRSKEIPSISLTDTHKKIIAGVAVGIFVLVIIVPVAVLITEESGTCRASATSGQISMNEGSLSVEVACKRGWIVIQRRGQYGNPQDYFYRNFAEYQAGFGKISGELWLGLDLLHNLTTGGIWLLEIELIDWNNFTYRAQYTSFSVEGPPMYTLHVEGYNHTGMSTAGDSLTVKHRNDWIHNGMAFSTKDNEQDKYGKFRHCAEKYTGAWWYNRCHASNLNGWNFPRRTSEWKGMTWYYGGGRGDTKATWMGSVMKIRKIK